jgi:hypothetical protein
MVLLYWGLHFEHAGDRNTTAPGLINAAAKYWMGLGYLQTFCPGCKHWPPLPRCCLSQGSSKLNPFRSGQPDQKRGEFMCSMPACPSLVPLSWSSMKELNVRNTWLCEGAAAVVDFIGVVGYALLTFLFQFFCRLIVEWWLLCF